MDSGGAYRTAIVGRGWVRSEPTPTPSPQPATGTPEPSPVAEAETAQEEPTPAYEPEPVYVPPPPIDLYPLICSYPWPCEEALRVKWCESGNRWDAIGYGNNYGGFQINSIHARNFPEFWTRWMDPEYNTYMAYTIWSQQGWKPWGCKPY